MCLTILDETRGCNEERLLIELSQQRARRKAEWSQGCYQYAVGTGGKERQYRLV